MKLYTEEELRKHLYNHDESFFDKLTPIELPSEEEIEEETLEETALSFLPHSEVEHDTDFIIGFEFGAKWMRDKIQGGNK